MIIKLLRLHSLYKGKNGSRQIKAQIIGSADDSGDMIMTQTRGDAMEWIDSITKAIDYIEKNLTEDLSVERISSHVLISPFYFQKGFSMLCGFTVADYIRQRRLAQAASELISTQDKIIDIALKYGYDSPDSFTKAFIRFHGITPSSARKNGAMIKSFAPLKISFTLKGGYSMDYKIVEKEAFTVIGVLKKFQYENAVSEIPAFWTEHYQSGKGNTVCGMYGINMDEAMGGKEFEYMIADDYDKASVVPDGFITKTIPAFTWAVFPCIGAMPDSMQSTNRKIFSEWLPNCKDYEFAAGYNIEMYGDPTEFAKGVKDERYYSELWIPVKHK